MYKVATTSSSVEQLRHRAIVAERGVPAKIIHRVHNALKAARAALLQALEAKKFPAHVFGFGYAVGHDNKLITWFQLLFCRSKLRSGNQSHRQISVFKFRDGISRDNDRRHVPAIH